MGRANNEQRALGIHPFGSKTLHPPRSILCIPDPPTTSTQHINTQPTTLPLQTPRYAIPDGRAILSVYARYPSFWGSKPTTPPSISASWPPTHIKPRISIPTLCTPSTYASPAMAIPNGQAIPRCGTPGYSSLGGQNPWPPPRSLHPGPPTQLNPAYRHQPMHSLYGPPRLCNPRWPRNTEHVRSVFVFWGSKKTPRPPLDLRIFGLPTTLNPTYQHTNICTPSTLPAMQFPMAKAIPSMYARLSVFLGVKNPRPPLDLCIPASPPPQPTYRHQPMHSLYVPPLYAILMTRQYRVRTLGIRLLGSKTTPHHLRDLLFPAS